MQINIDDYNYDLPEERIAQYPVNERDSSKILVLRDGIISQDIFKNIDNYIPEKSLLVFNNSKVVRARLLFGKESGAKIEVFCLEPLTPGDYESSFGSRKPVEWKCIIGNLKKWKKGVIKTTFIDKNSKYVMEADKICKEEGESWRVRFSWDADATFSEILEHAGHIPLPPYITRADETADSIRYQTVYSRIKGSVAAPTAGLHFTDEVFKKLRTRGIETAEITLHVGAGTFQPVKVKNALQHEMHCEHFIVNADTIKKIISSEKIIPVGTTSVRTIESLYWLGTKIINNRIDKNSELYLSQWECYQTNTEITVNEALNALLILMNEKKVLSLTASTSIMIVPGYNFRITKGIITNFHQPRSTLLLLISALAGEKWREIYRFAIKNNFRFLSYGDSSLLLP